MDPLLAAGAEVFAPLTLGLMALGVLAGLIAGAIPGFTIAMAIVLTLPFTYGMTAVEGIATMIGVYVGGLSGGLAAGMLTGIPGTPSSVATTFDGHPMVRGGRPGLALGIGVWASFFGGLIGAVILVAIAPGLARLGLEFGPWDYFALVLFALTISASLSGDDIVKGLIAVGLGLFAATVGEDDINGVARFAFGSESLLQGFAFLPVLVGLFAFSQLLGDLRSPAQARAPLMAADAGAVAVRHAQAIRTVLSQWLNLGRSALIGVFTGVLPAAGSSISNILAYDQAKKNSRYPEKFGTGIPDGIVAAESANNATAGGALITMMALGIPGDIVTAVMLGALFIHDVVPSPSFIRDQPNIAYGIFVAFFVAHFMMIALQSVSLRLFVLVTRVPRYILVAVILVYCAIGVFALNNIGFDLWTLLIFGVLGFAMRQFGFPLAPMILGVVLGRIAEVNLSRALTISDSLADAVVTFATRPWSLLFLILAAFSTVFPWYQKNRDVNRYAPLYGPLLAVALAVPLVLMPGWARPALGGIMAALGLWLVWRRRPGGEG